MTEYQKAMVRELISEMSMCHDESLSAVRGGKSSLKIALKEEQFYRAERDLLNYLSEIWG